VVVCIGWMLKETTNIDFNCGVDRETWMNKDGAIIHLTLYPRPEGRGGCQAPQPINPKLYSKK